MSYVVDEEGAFNGDAGQSIDISDLGCLRTDYGFILMPGENPGGDLGAIKLIRTANAIIIYNFGNARTEFMIIAFTCITAFEIQGGSFNVLIYGTDNYNGTTGVSIDISGIGTVTYMNPFILIQNTGDVGDIGEVWFTLTVNAIIVYNSGDSKGQFAYVAGKTYKEI